MKRKKCAYELTKEDKKRKDHHKDQSESQGGNRRCKLRPKMGERGCTPVYKLVNDWWVHITGCNQPDGIGIRA